MRKSSIVKRFLPLFLTALLLGGCVSDMENSNLYENSLSEDVSDEISEASAEEDTSEEVSDDTDTPAPVISVEKTEFSVGETISINYENTDEKDWIGFYPEGADPGTVNSIIWKYSVGSGVASFNSSALGEAGVYWAFLCDNDGYQVLDMLEITLLDNDKTDYGAKSATVNARTEDGFSRIEVTVTPGTEKEITYRLYWSAENKRLDGYEPLYTVTHSGTDSFEIRLNDGLFMPEEADGIEVAVAKGASNSVFVPVSESLKVPESKLLYKFNVLTDLHITPSRPQHTSHLSLAFADIISFGDSVAIFTCGDNTDRGTREEYALLLETVNKAGSKLPDIYYALGNHDIVYNNNAGYSAQINLFKNNFDLNAPYYSVELMGNRFIVLGSDTLSATGTVGKEQLEWLKSELMKTNGAPVFIFLHQPLIETVSGSLYSLDNEIQDWYGIYDSAEEIREILKNYPNAFLFTGHTHWSLESYQPVLLGRGEDANFVNCASVGYLWNDLDTATGGSEGFYVEVYEDYILLRGREFIKGNWCAAAQFKIPVYKD